MSVPDTFRYLLSGTFGAQGRKGGAQDLGHLRLGHLVASDPVV